MTRRDAPRPVPSTEQFQPVSVRMAPADRAPRPGLATSRSLGRSRTSQPPARSSASGPGRRPCSRRRATSTPGGGDAGRQELPTSSASTAGRRDGGVPAGDGGRLVISYTPQTPLLRDPDRRAGGGRPVSCSLALVLLFRTDWLRRSRPGARPTHALPAAPSPARGGCAHGRCSLVRRRGCSPACLPSSAVLVAALSARRPRLRWLALGLLLAGPSPAAAQLVDRTAAALRRRRPARGTGFCRRPDVAAPAAAGRRAVTGAPRRSDLGVAIAVAVLVLGPLLLRRGFVLRGDMVFVPRQPWKDTWLGTRRLGGAVRARRRVRVRGHPRRAG